MTTKTRTTFGLTVTFPGGSIAEITGYKRSGMERKAIDITHTASVEGFKEYLMSAFKDAGEIQIDFNADVDAFDTNAVLAADAGNVVITWPKVKGQTSAGTFTCVGGVTKIDDEGKVDDKIGGNLTIKFSGKPTLVVGS